MKALWTSLLVLVALIFTVPSCGGGSGDDSSVGGSSGSGGSDPAENIFIEELVKLDNQANQGQISNDEFLTQFYEILKKIEDAPDGTQLFKIYLEKEILGYEMTQLSQRTHRFEERSIGGIGDVIEGVNKTIENIKKTEVYQILEAFLTNVALNTIDLLSNDSPNSNPQQIAANPAIAGAFNTMTVRTQILEAIISGEIDDNQTNVNELLTLNSTNPFAAKKQLLQAKGEPIPSYLEPIPDNICYFNCESESGDTLTTTGVENTTTITTIAPITEPPIITSIPTITLEAEVTTTTTEAETTTTTTKAETTTTTTLQSSPSSTGEETLSSPPSSGSGSVPSSPPSSGGVPSSPEASPPASIPDPPQTPVVPPLQSAEVTLSPPVVNLSAGQMVVKLDGLDLPTSDLTATLDGVTCGQWKLSSNHDHSDTQVHLVNPVSCIFVTIASVSKIKFSIPINEGTSVSLLRNNGGGSLSVMSTGVIAID